MNVASKILFDEFDIVSSENDRLTVFAELGRSSAPIMAITDDELTFIFHIFKLEKLMLLMKPVEQSRELSADEKVFVIFSIPSGQYMMTGSLKQTREGIAVFNVNTELRRLQRRKNFRVSTHQTNSIQLKVEGVGPTKKPNVLATTDISAGGVSAIIPKATNSAGTLGQDIVCELRHPSRTISNLKGTIRHIDQVSNGEKWGIEFNHLTTDQMQGMLALSLQAHRENSSKLIF